MADTATNEKTTETTPATFVHLHVHSHYSLLNALPTPKELAYAAKADGQPALAITDNGALYGAIDFYKACTKEKIKPIIGLDAYLAPRTRHDRESQIDKPRSRLVLLAKTFHGYQNLIKLVTLSNTEGFYYRPRLDEELLRTYATDLIAIIPSFAGEVAQALKNSDMDRASERLDFYRGLYGNDCYLELTHHPEIMGHEENQARLVQIARASNTPLAAAHDVYYLKPEDRLARETMVKIQNGGVVDVSADHDADEDFSFITQARAAELFADTPDALSNTIRIAEECTVEIEIGTHWYFPNYIIESGREPDDELQVLAYQGAAWRGFNLETQPDVKTRLDYELEVIKNKGYAKYFLVVGDLLREARERGILTTIRGSVAGSLTTYVLGITNVNPLEYQLPFERFLNPQRPSAPDIDMDFADNRRDEIIEYTKTKYGEDKVAQIGTFGTMMARAAVRDVARALGHPYATGDRIAKLIPMGSQGFPMTIKKALEIEPDLADLYKKDAEAREVIDLAKQIEGRVRHLGVHAAGVVIAPEPLNQFVPIQLDPKTGKYITQYEMKSVGEDGVGLLKFDFLGIKNLAILADAVKRVKKIRNIDVDIENIPLDDPNTFAILAAGQTMGLFQLNGSGMTAFLKQLKPSSIHDINAMVALYRPGPMESIPQYIERKHNPSLVTYLDPRLKNILERSYGVITYQDDVMTIARELAGYSWLEADTLRKAMGKKIPEVMAAEKEKLLKGFTEFGKLSTTLGEKLWTLIEPFAAYGFNKCVTKDTVIVDAHTGIPTTIETMRTRRTKTKVWGLGTNRKLVCSTANGPFSNGKKPVYALTTRSGRTIKATTNHPFLTWSGWMNLSDLHIGDRLAAPRYIPPPASTTNLAPKFAATLGYLVSEGNLCHPNGVYYYSKNPAEVKDFIRNASAFSDTTFTIDHSKSAAAVYVGGGRKNQLWQLLTSTGLLGQTATKKFIPDIVWRAPNDALAMFLGKLWQGDGAISIKNQQTFYATSSRRLADDVQLALLRFAIISTIHTKRFRYRDGYKIGYTVVISGRENLSTFSQTIGRQLIGTKRRALQTVVKNASLRTNRTGRGSSDTLPAAIIDLIRSEMHRCNITVNSLIAKTNLAERLFYKNRNKRGYTRAVVHTIARALHSSVLKEHAISDIFWDEVVSIEEAGTEETFDLSVPGVHNFVANSLIVHNSHAASYGRVAYQTAYMKANFPVEYMSAVLTADSGDTEKIAEIIHECERMGIEVLPPDINESFSDFTVVPLYTQSNSATKTAGTGGMQGTGEQRPESYRAYGEVVAEPVTQQTDLPPRSTGRIRFGLTTIKNFGEGIAESIINERKQNGPYKSLADFLARVHDRNLNKKSLEALIMTGALDRFATRGRMYANLDILLAFNKDTVARREASQSSLFGGMDSGVDSLILNPAPDASTSQKLQWEKDLLGVYVSGHPLNAFKDEVAKRPRIRQILDDKRPGIPVVTSGMVASVRELLTKKGDRMAFVQLADERDTIEMVLFPRTYTEYRPLMQVGTCVAIKGQLSIRNDEVSIAVEKIKSLTNTNEPTCLTETE